MEWLGARVCLRTTGGSEWVGRVGGGRCPGGSIPVKTPSTQGALVAQRAGLPKTLRPWGEQRASRGDAAQRGSRSNTRPVPIKPE